MDNQSFCPRFKGIAYTTDIPNQLSLVRLRCKQWSCEYCAKKNRHIWYTHLAEALPKIGTNWDFVTLTAHSHSHAEHKTLQACQRGIDLMLKRIRQLCKISYVRVYEPHKTGEIHAHLIVSGLPTHVYWNYSKNGGKEWTVGLSKKWRLPEKIHRWSIKSWLKKTAIDCGIGYMVDIQAMGGDVQKSINYVLKYMSKD